MNQGISGKVVKAFRVTGIACLVFVAGISLVAFKTGKMYADVFSKPGITKDQANERIMSGLLGGYLNYYGMRNLKNIALNDRAAVIKDIAVYAKQYAATDAFKKEYLRMKERDKPKEIAKPETPEDMRASMIRDAKEYIANTEGYIKKADTNSKPIFEKSLEDAKLNLKKAEDPNNKNVKRIHRIILRW